MFTLIVLSTGKGLFRLIVLHADKGLCTLKESVHTDSAIHRRGPVCTDCTVYR